MTNNKNGLKGFLGSQTNPTAPKQTRTFEGGNAYEMNLEEKLNNIFNIGLFRGTFYKTPEDVLKAVRETFDEALVKMPYVATQYAVYAAETLGMKLAPTVWLVFVSTLEDKTLFKAAFPRIINNPKMLHDFMELARKGGIRKGNVRNGSKNGMGQSVKKTVNKWLHDKLNDYNTTRYTGKLEDVVRLTRPADKLVVREGQNGKYEVDTAKYFQYIVKPKDSERRLTFDRAESLQKVVDSLNAGKLTDEVVTLISKHKMQLEELKHTFGKLSSDQKKTVFMHFVPGLRYNALVSNLVAIERAFATQTRQVNKIDASSGRSYPANVVVSTDIPLELKAVVTQKLSNYEDYRGSKMLFFGLLTAHEMTSVQEWKTALRTTLSKAGKDAFADVPTGVKVKVGADTSGSMSMGSRKVTDSLYAVDIAAYLAAGIGMSIPGSTTYATADYSKKVVFNGNDNIINNAVKIKNTDVGYGTNFESLLSDYNDEKYVILVTDGEDSSNMEKKWASLKRPNGAKLIIWHVANFTHFTKISKRSDVLYLTGYSDQLMKTLSNIITGKTESAVVKSLKL